MKTVLYHFIFKKHHVLGSINIVRSKSRISLLNDFAKK